MLCRIIVTVADQHNVEAVSPWLRPNPVSRKGEKEKVGISKIQENEDS